MSQVTSVVSRHMEGSGYHYRVQLADGSMQLRNEEEVKATAEGKDALAKFDPHATFQTLPPPGDTQEGPSPDDIIRVQLGNAWHVCTVIRSLPDRTYIVKYDDGMVVQDKLEVPWNYVAKNTEKTLPPKKRMRSIAIAAAAPPAAAIAAAIAPAAAVATAVAAAAAPAPAPAASPAPAAAPAAAPASPAEQKEQEIDRELRRQVVYDIMARCFAECL